MSFLCARSGLYGVIFVSASLKKASLSSLTLLIAQITGLCCPAGRKAALCILRPTQASHHQPLREGHYGNFLVMIYFFFFFTTLDSICPSFLLFSFTQKSPIMNFNWFKACIVITMLYILYSLSPSLC